MKRVVIFSILISLCCGATAEHWPVVKNQRFVFRFAQTTSNTFTSTIVSRQDKPLYRLDCADLEGSKHLATSSDVWTGDLECHLLGMNERDAEYQSLLVARSDPSVSASRAVFLGYMLKGNCAKYPDWGLVRKFRLRGMKIVLALSDVIYSQYSTETHYEGIKSAILTIDVSPESSNTSAFALPSQYAEPRILNPEESDQNKYRVDCTHVRTAQSQERHSSSIERLPKIP